MFVTNITMDNVCTEIQKNCSGKTELNQTASWENLV